MQKRKRLVSFAQNERQRQTISVCLRPETVAELDRLAARSGRSRSRMAARLLEHAIQLIRLTDEPLL